jgi:predicted enzyme related to lactoylglutathione lyase
VFCQGGIGFVEEQEMENKKGERGIVLYMRVESVEGTLEKAKVAGGEVVKEMWVEGNHTQLGQFKDTEGNLVGVLKWGSF